MGIVDWVKDKLNNIPVYTKPLTDASKSLDKAPSAPPDAQKAQEKFLNRNNPHYPGNEPAVPKAKGGCVKKGGEPMKNVDNSGLTKEKLP